MSYLCVRSLEWTAVLLQFWSRQTTRWTSWSAIRCMPLSARCPHQIGEKKTSKHLIFCIGQSTANAGPTLSAEQSSHLSYWRGRRVKGAEGLRIGNSELVVPRATSSCCCLVRVASAQTCMVQWWTASSPPLSCGSGGLKSVFRPRSSW